MSGYESNAGEREDYGRYAYLVGDVGLWPMRDPDGGFHRAHPMSAPDLQADLQWLWENLNVSSRPMPSPKRFMVRQSGTTCADNTASDVCDPYLRLIEDGVGDAGAERPFRTMGVLTPGRFTDTVNAGGKCLGVWRVLISAACVDAP